jgi:hypothetical protein
MSTIRLHDLEARLQDLATGLFALEVNTILKANMSGARWSTTLAALHDIAAEYDAKLTALDVDHIGVKGEPLVDIAALGEVARRARESARETGRCESDVLMLARIQGNAGQIAAVFKGREQDLVSDLPADQFMIVRRIWELGAEEIVMQTVIHIDGDVITRIQPDKAGDGDLHALHNASVVTSVQLWQGLVSTLRAFAEHLVSALS